MPVGWRPELLLSLLSRMKLDSLSLEVHENLLRLLIVLANI